MVGPNGAGKTDADQRDRRHACARAAGASRSTGATSRSWPPHRFCEAGIALVPEGRRLFTDMTRAREPRARQLPAGARRRSAPARSSACCALFPALSEQARRSPAGALSGGQQQMVAIAPRADGAAAPAAARRAVARPVAADRARRCSAPSARSTPRAWRCCWWSRTSRWRWSVARRAYVLEEGRIVAEGAPQATDVTTANPEGILRTPDGISNHSSSPAGTATTSRGRQVRPAGRARRRALLPYSCRTGVCTHLPRHHPRGQGRLRPGARDLPAGERQGERLCAALPGQAAHRPGDRSARSSRACRHQPRDVAVPRGAGSKSRRRTWR